LISVEPGETGKRTKGVVRKKMRSGAVVRRLGPLGLSLVAAAITAAGFAAISVAAKDDNGGGSNGGGDRGERMLFHAGPGGPGGPMEDLSAEDRQKLEDFRQCMSEHGAEPPAPPKFDPDNPPQPPSSEEIERIRKAHEACKDKLPEDLQDMPGPSVRAFGCGPGGPPPARSERGENQGENQSQGFVVPAPAPSGTS
jgi:hypothetical protein